MYGTINKMTENRLADEELVTGFLRGDNTSSDALIMKYKPLVKQCARAYFIAGADKEDIIQEGMIGLYKAVRDFNPDRGVPFYSFAQMCITRQILSAIKTAARHKHTPLSGSVSLSGPAFNEDSEMPRLETILAARDSNPEELFIGKEGKRYLEAHVGGLLSEMECRVLSLHLRGHSYQYIADAIGKDEKSVDNAVQRMRRKIEKFLRREP